jgi:hypothetical protein
LLTFVQFTVKLKTRLCIYLI